MNSMACPYETAVVRAARAGLWNEALRAHEAVCASCRETAAVTAFLNSAAAVPEHTAELSDARLLWLRRNLIKTEKAVEHSLLPIRAAEALVWSAVLGASIGWPIWTGSSLFAGLKAGLDAVWNGLLSTSVSAFGGSTVMAGLAAFTAVCAGVVTAVEADLADD